MNEDDYKKLELEAELDRLKRERESERKSYRIIWFLAIWLLPLFGMELVQGAAPPAKAGSISLWGIWFLGVPIVAWLCRKLG